MELLGTKSTSLKSQNYECKICQYKTGNKNDFKKHLVTAKHLRNKNGSVQTTNKKSQKYFCEKCNYITNNKSNFNKHISTSRHLLSTFTTKQKSQLTHVCETCGKEYKYASGLWKHKQKCNMIHQQNNSIIQTDKELIKIIMEENAKLNKQNAELHADVQALIPKVGNNNNTNSNNQSFNINFFLNETCKDAMNMKDFIENIKLTLENVIYASKNGVINSSRKLIVKGLQDLELTERPIHCTDVKKNTMYIKEEGLWNMDKENEKLKKILQNVSVKHMKGISEWIVSNPYYMETEKGQQEYVQMVKNITQDISGCEKDIQPTIKNICKETLVE